MLSFGWLLPATAQTCLYTFEGRVLDAHDESSMEEVRVYVQELNKEVWTDANGQFTFAHSCPGEYHIVFQHVGCPLKRLHLQVEKDTTILVFLEHHQNMLHEVDVHDHHEEAIDDQRIGKLILDENSQKSLAAATGLLPGVSTLSNGTDIGLPIVQGLSGNRMAIVNNGFVHMGQQWGADHSPEVDLNTAGEVVIVSGSGTIRYPGSHMGGIVVLKPKTIALDPHLHGKVRTTAQSNGRGAATN